MRALSKRCAFTGGGDFFFFLQKGDEQKTVKAERSRLKGKGGGAEQTRDRREKTSQKSYQPSISSNRLERSSFIFFTTPSLFFSAFAPEENTH